MQGIVDSPGSWRAILLGYRRRHRRPHAILSMLRFVLSPPTKGLPRGPRCRLGRRFGYS